MLYKMLKTKMLSFRREGKMDVFPTFYNVTGIKTHPDSTGYDTTALTYKTPFDILKNAKNKFSASEAG